MGNLNPPAKLSRISRLASWFLKQFFNLLYHQYAWSYDFVAWVVSLGNWKNWIRTSLDFVHGPLVLELGHGPGHLQTALSKAHLTSIAIDKSWQMSKQAHNRLIRAQMRARLVNSHTQRLPFASNIFSEIISTFPSEYIADPRSLAEMYRVLTPGGSAYVLLIAWFTGKKFLEKIATWLFRVTGEAPAWDDRFLEPAHHAGFLVHTKFIILPNSKLAFMIFQKPAEQTTSPTG